jgi:hypothetical protein
MNYYLFHYYDKELGPFKNLSSLPIEQAEVIMNRLKAERRGFASQRSDDYLRIRRGLEEKARELFISKGGRPLNQFPHYMTLGECRWIKEWYSSGAEISLALDDFNEETISFTYGDLFPTMRYNDGKEYREQIYTKIEIFKLISKYGLPQVWNREGEFGPERYIEVQIWDDVKIRSIVENHSSK